MRIYIQAQTEPPESEESKESEESHPALMSFLRRAEPLICEQLVQNASSRAFDGYHISTQFSSAKIQLWNSLSVNLEQRKVSVCACAGSVSLILVV